MPPPTPSIQPETIQTPSTVIPVAPALPESVRAYAEFIAEEQCIPLDEVVNRFLEAGMAADKASNSPPIAPHIHQPGSVPLPRLVRTPEGGQVIRLPTSDDFMEKAGQRMFTFGSDARPAQPMVFESGSYGWRYQGEIAVGIDGPGRLSASVSLSIVVKGSKRGKQADNTHYHAMTQPLPEKS